MCETGESLSGLRRLRNSAQEGATTSAAVNYQGMITQAGYQEQQQSYELMASAAQTAASAEQPQAHSWRAALMLSPASHLCYRGVLPQRLWLPQLPTPRHR